MAHQISHENRCIFVHVPKAGGTSVERTAIFDDQREATDEYVGGHCTALEYRAAYPDQFETYFKFGFVRDPFHRLASAFAYLSSGGTNSGDRAAYKQYVAPFAGDFQTFCAKSLLACSRTVVHFRPQVDFLCDQHGRVLVDFVGHVEQMDDDFAEVTRRLRVQCRLQHRNRSPAMARPARIEMEQVRDIVQSVYERDFDTFSYSGDSANAVCPAVVEAGGRGLARQAWARLRGRIRRGKR